ncbi:hypothetical protein D3C87_2025550 [compost metagenome]
MLSAFTDKRNVLFPGRYHELFAIRSAFHVYCGAYLRMVAHGIDGLLDCPEIAASILCDSELLLNGLYLRINVQVEEQPGQQETDFL